MNHPAQKPHLPAQPDEEAWLEVIRKMDEVYSQLVSDEVILQQKNEELERTQQFLFSLLSAMSDVLIACNHLGEIEETNAALCELVGRTDAQLRGQSVFALLADDTSEALLRGLVCNTPLQRGNALIELTLRGADGQPVPVDINCTPRVDSRGRRAGCVMVGRPMAEVRRAYRELSDAHEALKRTQQQLLHSEKMASLGRLVAGVAHELNNPISFVLGNVHALKRYSERLGTYLDSLHEHGAQDVSLRGSLRIDHILSDLPSLISGTLEGAERAADIVNGLRRFSAIDREERLPVELGTVVDRAIEWISRGTGGAMRVQREPSEPLHVSGSAGQLQQVMMNLIQNAADAATMVGRLPEIRIMLQRGQDDALVSVRDNGPGIAEQHLSQIFDPFFTTKPIGKGTGLGLSISYGIIEQHNGVLLARNHPESGAEFTIRLPLRTDTPAV